MLFICKTDPEINLQVALRFATAQGDANYAPRHAEFISASALTVFLVSSIN